MLMCVGLGTEADVGERGILRNWAALQRRRTMEMEMDYAEAYLGCFA